MKKPPADFASRRAAGESLLSLATAYGAAKRTVAAWNELPEVREEIERIRSGVVDDAIGQLSEGVIDAIRAVLEIARGKAACSTCGRGATLDRDRLKAAEILLARVHGLEPGQRREITATVSSDGGADERLILAEASDILDARGLTDLASQVKAEARR
jgi:hypothetical protein